MRNVTWHIKELWRWWRIKRAIIVLVKHLNYDNSEECQLILDVKTFTSKAVERILRERDGRVL